MRNKSQWAVFRQILPGDLLEAQNYHFEGQSGHFEIQISQVEAKIGQFGPTNGPVQAKIYHFEGKTDHFGAKIDHFATKTAAPQHCDGFRRQNVQNESRIFFDEFFMRLKGKRAVFRQILPGDPLEAQICHFELANHQFEAKMLHFEAKMKHFEAKTDHFEPKIAHFEAKIVHFATKTAAPKHLDPLRRQIFQNASRTFFDEFFMRLKGKRAVFRQILPGDPLEAQICRLDLKFAHFKAKMKHFEAKIHHVETKMKHFEAKSILKLE